jgi:hypothetical protein
MNASSSIVQSGLLLLNLWFGRIPNRFGNGVMRTCQAHAVATAVMKKMGLSGGVFPTGTMS